MQPLSIELILDIYRIEVTESLALTYSVADEFPIEILNEVRNAFTHLARSSSIGVDTDEGKRELVKSENHLLRCRIDCAKLCLLVEAEKLDKDMEALVHATVCPQSILEDAERLKEDRRNLATKEANGPGNEIVVLYLELFEKYQDYRNHLRDEYGSVLVNAFEQQLQNRINKAEIEGLKKGRRQTIWRAFGVGLITSVLGALLLRAFGV